MTLKFDVATGNIQLTDPATGTYNLSEIMEIIALRKWGVEQAQQLAQPVAGATTLAVQPTADSIIADAEKLVMYVVRGPVTTDVTPPVGP